ncbi:MAG: helix-turn-helix domain-containing protein [Gracilimonas sp.]
MEQALRVAREKLKEIRTVTEWAEKMGYECPKYYSNRFKRQYGLSPKPKLVVLRIEKFQKLIKEKPELSCYEIALQLGLEDEKVLNKYIKTHTGKAPREWRNGE